MAYSFRHTSPELAGVLIKEKVRCGKQNCRCVRLKRLHKGYYYLYWRDYRNNAKLKKSYVPKSKIRKLRQNIKSAKAKDRQEKYRLRLFTAIFNKLTFHEKQEIFD
jgi:hypothetical protein